MSIHHQDERVTLHHGDCLDVLRTLPDASVDSVVCDPPYGLEFMGKGWDAPWQESGVNADAGFHGGGISATKSLPSFTGSTNPKCARCKGTRRGRRDGTAKVAVCLCEDGGRFPNTRAVEMRAFGAWCELWAAECLRVLKPGGHLLAFGGTRTWHRLACAVEDAGFEVRDSLAWLYGSGFPKSLDVSKAIDKASRRQYVLAAVELGLTVPGNNLHDWTKAEHSPGDSWWEKFKAHLSPEDWQRVTRVVTREAVRAHVPGDVIGFDQRSSVERERRDIPATPDAERWQGWGTALKPAFEPVVVARKPLAGTVAANVLAHGTGALNIDACRIGDGSESQGPRPEHESSAAARYANRGAVNIAATPGPRGGSPSGRWPANVILDESHEPVLRLRYNLPTEVERTIRESFGASTDHLPAVRDTRDGAAEQGQASEVLHPQVPGALDVGEPDGRASSEVGQAAYAGNSGADLGDQEGQPPHGREGRELEGRALPEPGLCLREVVDAPAERAGDLRADGDPQRRDLHSGAPASGRPATRAGADPRGDRPSHQRTQGGQPAGEPRAPRVEQFAPDEARRGGRRDVPAASGERATTGAPLEVLRRECPPGWWQYFDVVGHRRESQAATLDEQTGTSRSRIGKPRGAAAGDGWGMTATGAEYDDEGGASRFFYVAKAPKRERPVVDGVAHPTVKPLALMRWLVRLVTPPGGVVLEPFAGSGTTVEACIQEGVRCIAIEKGDEYLPLILERIRRSDPDRVADEVTRTVDVDAAIVEQVPHDEPWLFELNGEGA